MEINFLAVLVAAVASMIVGSIWYGPLFGKMFIREMGMDQWTPERRELEKKKMGVSYTLQFIASLVMFYVLAKFMNDSSDLTVNGGIMTALWIWIGFVVPVKVGDAVWGGKWSLFWLSVGNMLVTLVAAGAIIGGWR